MAQKVVVTLWDDLDDGEASETVTFGLDGKSYEIDLSEKNAQQLRSIFEPYLQAARRQTKTGKAFRRTAVAPDPKAVRAWAEANGMDVPARGRIPRKVYEAFNEAH
ncbi:Lsr2 family protein [Streptomyces sp. YIM 98790]|uniref:histone-like nucleoid-structuring protein Lsr2 n=1 Tax=Streptomyces sp. YIM 98790 TaxID=2689077 RepID=UPI0014084FE3|nr:Lsr2 family protein [Streptomyces sp. YIM 98790]